MYRNSSDKRVQRSGKLLFDALVKLLEIKPFSDIGIKEISEHANIGRATFYRNFDYIEDVIKLKVDQLFEELNEITDSETSGAGDPNRPRVFFHFWINHPDVLQVLLKSNSWPIFTNSLLESFKVNLAELTFHAPLTPIQNTYFESSISAQISSILQTWVTYDQNETAEELFNLFRLPYQLAMHHNFIE